jgi:hypothetical protein
MELQNNEKLIQLNSITDETMKTLDPDYFINKVIVFDSLKNNNFMDMGIITKINKRYLYYTPFLKDMISRDDGTTYRNHDDIYYTNYKIFSDEDENITRKVLISGIKYNNKIFEYKKNIFNITFISNDSKFKMIHKNYCNTAIFENSFKCDIRCLISYLEFSLLKNQPSDYYKTNYDKAKERFKLKYQNLNYMMTGGHKYKSLINCDILINEIDNETIKTFVNGLRNEYLNHYNESNNQILIVRQLVNDLEKKHTNEQPTQ